MAKNHIDPNDPVNVDLMNRISDARKAGGANTRDTTGAGREGETAYPRMLDNRGYFRLDDYHDQLVFGNREDVEENVRFKLIRLRDNGVDDFKNLRMIPASEREIPKNLVEIIRGR